MPFKKIVKKIKTVEVVDYVTNLLDRSVLINRRANENDVVVYIDIDNFKLINDAYGHVFGDMLLKKFSEFILYKVSDKGRVYRYSGDDFIIIFNDISQDKIYKIMTLIKEELKQNFYVNDTKVSISLSAGIYKPQKNEPIIEAIRKADIALHEAKNLSKSMIMIFTNEFEEKIIEKTNVVNNVYHAMQINEIKIHYQPIYSTKEGKISDAEALVRWNSSLLGYVSPAKFIPIIEEAGYIKDLDRYVLNKSIYDFSKLIHKNKDVVLSINVSAETISKNYIQYLIEVADKYKMSYKNIKLEITETAILSNKKEIIESVKLAKDYGIKIAFDDFGSGYSSIKNLMVFLFDEIKLDKLFIDNILVHKKYYYLAKTFIDVCHNFNYKVVAEGVETKEQFDTLLELGCDKIQGFYISKPLPFDELMNYINK